MEKKINETKKCPLNFKEGSISEKVYKLYFDDKKTEAEIAKKLKLDFNKVHKKVLNLNKKLKRASNKSITLPTSVMDMTATTTNTPDVYKEQPVDMKGFVPTTDGYIQRKIGNSTDLKILEQAYKNKHNVLLVGETGTGKTHLVRNFAYKHKYPYARINLNGGTTADELIGHWVPRPDGGFRWQDGVLTTFVRNGGVIAIDEVNACPAEILFSLHSLLDDERKLVLVDKDGEVVHAHENFFLVSTMNPDYEGTKPLNEAFKDRFQVKLFFDYDAKVEKKLIVDDKVLELAEKLRVMKAKDELSVPISTRMLIYFKHNTTIYGPELATEMFLNNFEHTEREPIMNVIELMKSGKKVNDEETKQETPGESDDDE